MLDTGGKDHICNNKSLFIGDMQKLDGVAINGVGGQVQVHAYGTINIRIVDDDSNPHDLIIQNVLYMPDSPANFISPQTLTRGHPASMSKSAFIAVWADTTLFAWGNAKYVRTLTSLSRI